MRLAKARVCGIRACLHTDVVGCWGRVIGVACFIRVNCLHSDALWNRCALYDCVLEVTTALDAHWKCGKVVPSLCEVRCPWKVKRGQGVAVKEGGGAKKGASLLSAPVPSCTQIAPL